MDTSVESPAKDMDARFAGTNLDAEPIAEVVESTTRQSQWEDAGVTTLTTPTYTIEYRVLDDVSEEDPPPVAPPAVIIPPAPEPEIRAPIYVKTAVTNELKSGDFPTLSELQKKRKSLPDNIDGQWSSGGASDAPTIHFGTNYPRYAANKGDLFLKLNALPTLLYKFNGEEWIESSKNLTDVYAFDKQYVNYLIHKISTGEYDPELLTDAERTQIENRLREEF